MDKQTLRKQMLDARIAMRDEQVRLLSKMISNKLLGLSFVHNARRIMAYCTHQNEPDLMDFMLQCLDNGKCVSLPYVVGKGQIVPVDFKRDCHMQENRYGILEPVLENKCDPLSADVVIVPGIAYDKKRYRVGYGGGYYDRFLVGTNAIKIGVCYDSQIVDEIKHDAHDIAMDIIVTEQRILGMG